MKEDIRIPKYYMEKSDLLYDIDYAKKVLNEYLKKGLEPELCFEIDSNTYMIIPLKDKISFQWIGRTEEFYFNNVEELFSSELVNGIILNKVWDKIDNIYYY